ncbi:hypothetical protein JCM16408A_16440 [Methylobacterium phyllosphaerae]
MPEADDAVVEDGLEALVIPVKGEIAHGGTCEQEQAHDGQECEQSEFDGHRGRVAFQTVASETGGGADTRAVISEFAPW